jgi:hypothetical protein
MVSTQGGPVPQKPPKTVERLEGSVPDNVNCKPPHVVERIVERLCDNSSLPSKDVEGLSKSLFDDHTKSEWFFDESRSSVCQQWSPRSQNGKDTTL